MDEWRAPCHGDPRAPAAIWCRSIPMSSRAPTRPAIRLRGGSCRAACPSAPSSHCERRRRAAHRWRGLPAAPVPKALLLQHVKSAVDVAAVAGGLLDEARDAAAVEDDCAETTRRYHHGQRCIKAMPFVKRHQRANIRIPRRRRSCRTARRRAGDAQCAAGARRSASRPRCRPGSRARAGAAGT